jgi:recombination protein RecT
MQKTDPLRSALASTNFAKALQDAVPVTVRKYLTPERVVRIVMGAASRSPELLECVPATVLRAVIDLVQLGIEPGGPLCQGYLVPFRNRKNGDKLECVPIVGYQGYIALARRSGEIASVFAQVIYSNDRRVIRYGDEPKIEHEPCLDGDRGVPVAAYCVAQYKDGGKHIEVMTVSDIEKIRDRAPSGKSKYSPWATDWEMMARKTVIRRARHYWPLSVEMAQAAELDDRVDVGEYVDGGKLETVAEEAEPSKTQSVLAKIQGETAAKEATVDEPPHDPKTGEVTTTTDEDHDYGPPPMTDAEIEVSTDATRDLPATPVTEQQRGDGLTRAEREAKWRRERTVKTITYEPGSNG